jgi:superfamily II DNA/RNA helicase
VQGAERRCVCRKENAGCHASTATTASFAKGFPLSDNVSVPSFADLGVPAGLLQVLAARGVTTPFPIQAATLPDSLAGRDVLGRGRTGSGKTIAFAVPTIVRLTASGKPRRPGRPRALVLLPTRELATQVAETMTPLATAAGLKVTTVFGGVGQNPQVSALRSGIDVLIACPGRLEDLIGQGHVQLDAIEVTVLDEADHMADLGFLPGVKRLLDRTPQGTQRLLFSATLDNGVDIIVKRYLRQPVTHSVAPVVAETATMTHHVLAVGKDEKPRVIHELAGGRGRSLLFMRTKHTAKKLARQLTAAGIPAVDLHGNLSQNARERNLAAFSDGSVRVLVATDIAARGIHVDDINLVVHVDPPAEHKAYTHRSGRTARAGAAGVVVTLMTPDQHGDVRVLTPAGRNPSSAGSRDPWRRAATRPRRASSRVRDSAGRGAGAGSHLEPAQRSWPQWWPVDRRPEQPAGRWFERSVGSRSDVARLSRAPKRRSPPAQARFGGQQQTAQRTMTTTDQAAADPVPVYRPYLGPEVQQAAQQALQAGWLGMGKLTQQFEESIERYLGLDGRKVVATNSCTEALHIAGQLIGLGAGDEVICPSFTYVAGHQAISRTGAEIVFCDVEPKLLGIDPAKVEELITDRTRAILAVDYLGLPCRLDDLMALAAKYDLRVIEDAAHAFGSKSDGRPVGSFGDITCFSFGPVKTITSLEGGAVITNNPADVQTLRELRHLGIDSDTDALQEPPQLGLRCGAPGLPLPPGVGAGRDRAVAAGDGRRVHHEPGRVLPGLRRGVRRPGRASGTRAVRHRLDRRRAVHLRHPSPRWTTSRPHAAPE